MNYWWASRKIWTLASRYQRQRSSCLLSLSPLSVHARTPASIFLFLFQPLDVTSRRRDGDGLEENPFSEAGAHTWLRTNKWDETDDTAYIVLRHIPCQPGEDHALVIPWPPRVLRSPISTTASPLGLQPLTPAKHPLIGCRFTFSLPILASRHHFATMDHRHLVFSSVGTQVFQKNSLSNQGYLGIFTIRNYILIIWLIKEKFKLFLNDKIVINPYYIPIRRSHHRYFKGRIRDKIDLRLFPTASWSSWWIFVAPVPWHTFAFRTLPHRASGILNLSRGEREAGSWLVENVHTLSLEGVF